MTIPADYPLILYRGDSFRYNIVCWLDSAKTEPLDLTGVVAKSEIRETEGSVPIASITCTISLPQTVVCFLPPEVSQTLPLAGVWDLQLTYPSGDVLSIVKGTVNVTPDVTGSSS